MDTFILMHQQKMYCDYWWGFQMQILTKHLAGKPQEDYLQWMKVGHYLSKNLLQKLVAVLLIKQYGTFVNYWNGVLSPLEAAYLCSLTCQSALNKHLFRFTFNCKEIKAGRIFPTMNTNDYDKKFTQVKANTMYFVDETRGKPSHPLFNLYFLSEDATLVVSDVTGSADNTKVLGKQQKLSDHWISKAQQDRDSANDSIQVKF